MSFIKRWDVDDILRQLNRCHAEVNRNENDSYTQLGCKKDLLTVKYALDSMLNNSQNFGYYEQEIIDEFEKLKTWNIINEHST
jgi:hypothetical protein